jgi:acrylyl-CoA reductase (NADPH)
VRELRTLDPEELPPGEVTVRVAYSDVNYKDALATIAGGGVARTSPLVPGIDLVGEVVESSDEGVSEGQQVIVHGYETGVARHGGFAEYARVPAEWIVPLPEGLDARSAMALGTAGFTAALSVHLLEERGLGPDHGPVLVTGATGGVGSVAVGILADRGYEVAASTGSDEEHPYLESLGAHEIVSREETSAESKRPLEKERWAATVDPVGGATLAYALRTLRYGGAAAVSGLTGGTGLETTVLPFILRAVTLIGVDSVQTDIELRRRIWERLAGDLRPSSLEAMTREVGLEDVEGVLDSILEGGVRGRTVVRIAG